MFEGDMEQGELEIGQVSAMLDRVRPAAEILNAVWKEFLMEKERISEMRF